MKKIFLILALTALMSIGANASVKINAKQNNDAQQQGQSAPSILKSSTEWYNEFADSFVAAADSFVAAFDMEVDDGSLADSFVAAFGMEVDAGGSGDAGPSAKGLSKGSSSGKRLGVGMSAAAAAAASQVAPPFTPYTYQK